MFEIMKKKRQDKEPIKFVLPNTKQKDKSLKSSSTVSDFLKLDGFRDIK